MSNSATRKMVSCEVSTANELTFHSQFQYSLQTEAAISLKI